jgi:hypothetical protein
MFNQSTASNMKSYLASVALGASLFSFAMGANAECVRTEDGTGVHTEILYAGQTIEAGTVTTEVVGTDLTITYETSGGWELQETHVWVGTDLADMPQTRKGSPKIGNFPYQSGDITGATSYSVTIPLLQLGFSCPSVDTEYFVAAHAAVQLNDGAGNIIQTETGWSDGDRYVERGMWGTYSTVTLTCDCGTTKPPVAGQCETAFAYSGGTNVIDSDSTNSFLEIVDEDGGSFNRWGWSNGAIGAGSYSWDIYAGAGQSDITKGTLVGRLTVVYDGSAATVWFDMTEGSPYYHLYVGNEILARDVNGEYTVAPGQYPTIHDELNGATSDSYNIEELSGYIYVVAHATVCGFQQ